MVPGAIDPLKNRFLLERTMKTYRFALIGIGGMGDLYAQAVGDTDRAELVGGSCRTAAKGRVFAERFGCPDFRDAETMIDELKPDVAIISTPSGAHLEPAVACARRGVHVVCTKPLEITTARCDAMIAAAGKAGTVLAGMFPNRFTPVMRAIHAAATAGRFGDLAVVNAYTPWWRDDDYYGPGRWQGTAALDGGGAVINQSIHGIDATQWIAAAALGLLPQVNPVEEVFAYTSKRAHDEDLIEVEDTAVVCLRFRGGALGQLLCTTSMYPGSLKRFQIAGRDGTAATREDELTAFDFRDSCKEDQQLKEKFQGQSSAGGVSDPLAINPEYEAIQFRALIEALDNGEPPPIDGREARKAVAIIEAIYESARSGRPARPK